jgi:hypothetical protein
MWVVQPGDGSPDDDVPGDGSPDWIGGDQDDVTGALDGPGLLGSDGGEGLDQGLWLTASAPRPPGLVSSVAAGGGTGVFGFGQGGVMEALPPGPVLAAFTAEAAGGICGAAARSPQRPSRPRPAPGRRRQGTQFSCPTAAPRSGA